MERKIIGYQVIKRGGSLGECNGDRNYLYPTKEEAQAEGKRYKSSYGAAARKYYGVGYSVKPVYEK